LREEGLLDFEVGLGRVGSCQQCITKSCSNNETYPDLLSVKPSAVKDPLLAMARARCASLGCIMNIRASLADVAGSSPTTLCRIASVVVHLSLKML